MATARLPFAEKPLRIFAGTIYEKTIVFYETVKHKVCPCSAYTIAFDLLRFLWKKDDNADEINMLRLYVNKYFEEPEKLELLKLDKYEAENNEVYYHIKWIYAVDGDDTPVELLVVYSRARQMIELAFFGDMEAGLKRDVKEQWNKLKQAPPERVFTSEELSAFMSKIIE